MVKVEKERGIRSMKELFLTFPDRKETGLKRKATG
jgi:hypothetical protein